MMRNGLPIFLLIFTIASGSDGKKCSKLKNCKKCLIEGGGSECVWFVGGETGPKTGCIDGPLCEDEAYQAGTCYPGGDGKFIQMQCKAAKPPKKCEDQNKCKKCIVDDDCAFYVNGKDEQCIDKEQCDGKGYETGECHIGELFPDNKKACRRIKKGNPPVKCNEIEGDCTTCLRNGCSWVLETQTCLDSCKDAPEEIGCYATTPPVEFVDDRRNLLRFEDEASAKCFFPDMTWDNIQLCGSVKGDCKDCVDTLLFTDPTINYFIAPTCQIDLDTLDCVHIGGSLMCPPDCGHMWPELMSKTYEFAESFLKDTYGGYFAAISCQDGDIFCLTEDYLCNRVRLWVDDEGVIIDIPQVG